MQVDTSRLFLSSGLIAGDDTVSLAVGLRVEGRLLVDDAVGARHELHPVAAVLIRRLQQPTIFSEWLRLCERRRIKPEEIQEIVHFLNGIGGLRIQQSPQSSLWKIRFRLLSTMYGVRRAQHTRRYKLGLRGIMQGVTRASLLVLALVPFTVWCLFVVGLPAQEAAGYSIAAYVIFWLATVAHEAVHACFVRQGSAVVLQKGMNVGILHQSLTPGKEILSALCGPFAGVASAVIGGMSLAYLTGLGHVLGVSVVLAIAQLWSLMPWYGDGITIKKLWRGIVWRRSSAMNDTK